MILEFILYLTILMLPAINWLFNFGSFQVSIVEILAGVLAALFFIDRFVQILQGRSKLKDIKWPLLLPISIFVVIGAISVLFSQYMLFSGWYLVRWVLFFYLAYVVVPYNIIKNGDILKRSLITLFISGILVAIMGLISLYYQDWGNSFFRVQPIKVFGIYPLGTNHNLIAEFLVIVAWSSLALKHWFKSIFSQRLIDVLAVFLMVVTVGTFSRTGWIVLALEISVYLIINNIFIKKQKLKLISLVAGLCFLIIILAPFAYRMATLQADNTSSTANRVLLTQIAWRSMLAHPIIGYGPGMFVNLVDNNIRFRANYGDPLDSHGVLQKVMAEMGLLGVLSLAYLLFYIGRIFFLALKKYPPEAQWLIFLEIAVLGGFAYQFFNTSYYKGKLWLPVALVLSAINLLSKKYARLQK